jgi:hypothetical protein
MVKDARASFQLGGTNFDFLCKVLTFWIDLFQQKLFILHKFEREEVKGRGLGPTNSNIESLEIVKVLLAVLTFSNKQQAGPAAFYNDVPTAGKSHKILLISKYRKTPRFQSPNLTNSTLFSLF